jgi:DNA-binding Xre family transcriptional regulator
MKLGDNIREIREVEKSFKRSYVAGKLGITTKAYGNIENNVADITLTRLEDIANILECSVSYILSYKETKKEFYNHFQNFQGSKSINIQHQNLQSNNSGMIYKLQQELLQSERDRITLLEALLKKT